jgi:hypothetical protein
MYTNNSNEYAGSPPPILILNGYGDHVFKNVPVVVKSFSVTLPPDVDYISTTISDLGNLLGDLGNIAGVVGSVASVLGNSSVNSTVQKFQSVVGTAQSLAGRVTSLFGGAKVTHVPAKSTINVNVIPVYSRDMVRKFDLGSFVSGDYVKGSGGYI